MAKAGTTHAAPIPTGPIPTATINAARFKEQCLALLDHLDEAGLIVTKHGRPVARVLPWREAPADLIGSMRGQLAVHGDLRTTGLDWEAARDGEP